MFQRAGCNRPNVPPGRLRTRPGSPVEDGPNAVAGAVPLFQSTQQVLARYSTAELELLVGFLRQLADATEQLIEAAAVSSARP
jgi:hypothetical protein